MPYHTIATLKELLVYFTNNVISISDISKSVVNYTIVIPPPPRPPLPPRPTTSPAPTPAPYTPPPPPIIITPHQQRPSGGGGGYRVVDDHHGGGGKGNGVYHVGDCASNPCQVRVRIQTFIHGLMDTQRDTNYRVALMQ